MREPRPGLIRETLVNFAACVAIFATLAAVLIIAHGAG